MVVPLTVHPYLLVFGTFTYMNLLHKCRCSLWTRLITSKSTFLGYTYKVWLYYSINKLTNVCCLVLSLSSHFRAVNVKGDISLWLLPVAPWDQLLAAHNNSTYCFSWLLLGSILLSTTFPVFSQKPPFLMTITFVLLQEISNPSFWHELARQFICFGTSLIEAPGRLQTSE